MGVTFRPATLQDVPGLHALRRDAIAALAAPQGMARDKAKAWAFRLTLAGMEQKFQELEIWVAESSGTPIAWGGLRDDYLAGLYVHPGHAGHGVGRRMLAMLEELMQGRGHTQVRTDASRNAEAFYLKHGYEQAGEPTADDGLPLLKRLGV